MSYVLVMLYIISLWNNFDIFKWIVLVIEDILDKELPNAMYMYGISQSANPPAASRLRS